MFIDKNSLKSEFLNLKSIDSDDPKINLWVSERNFVP